MDNTLHITSGDIAGQGLVQSGIPGEVIVWHDIMYDGPRKPGWPDDEILDRRAQFIVQTTAGGLERSFVLDTLKHQYGKLAAAGDYDRIVLWFDACLFDQSMLVHILACLDHLGIKKVELLCVEAFTGIEPFNGLGQLEPAQLGSLYDLRCPVTDAQFHFAKAVDDMFALQDLAGFDELSRQNDAPLSWIPAAVARWLDEQPDPETGLGQLESMILEAVRSGRERPWEIFSAVAAADRPPQYWGDTTLWAKINGLADRTPPMLQIHGPAERLPQWKSPLDLSEFRIR